MTHEGNCPFCNAGERVLKENGTAQAILSNPRKVAGHVLVMPKRHVEQPWELTHEELQDVFELIFDIEQKLVDKLGDGCDIRQNYRPFKEQSDTKVNHVTFHVTSRSAGDYIYTVSEKYETDLFADLDDLERHEVTKLLK